MSLRMCTALAVSAACLALTPQPAVAETVYTITPLVTDSQAALTAAGFGQAVTVDPNLINPWGVSLSPTGPFWVSNQGSNTSTLYDGDGNPFPIGNPLVVDIPHAGPPAGPTGQAFVGGTGLKVPSGGDAIFAFANLDGSISAWTPGTTTAQVVVPAGTTGTAVYTGLTITGTGADTRLYAANHASGRIDVFDSNYQPVSTAGKFVDPGDNPNGLLPFNVKAINGQIYVTYAIPGDSADAAPLGSGFVSVFDMDGNFVRRFASDGQLASPWGVALAPDGFGDFSNALLIGNFNEEFGHIGAYDPTSAAFLGLLADANGTPLTIPYLWEILFGNGTLSDAGDLYFAAGIGDEQHGLFGEIAASEAIPEPATFGLIGLGMLAIAARRQTGAARSVANVA